MNLSPKTLAVSAGGLLILVFLIAWITGDTSDPGKKQDDLAFLDEPISDSPFLDDFGTPPSINDAPPEELDPETSIAKNEPPAKSQASPVAGDGEAILIKPKRPLPGKSKPAPPESPVNVSRPTQPDEGKQSAESGIAKNTLPSPSEQKPTAQAPAKAIPAHPDTPTSKQLQNSPKVTPTQPAKIAAVSPKTNPAPPKATLVPPKAVAVPPKAVPVPPKAVPVPPKATPVVPRAVALEEDPPARQGSQHRPAVELNMKSPTNAPDKDRSNVIKQASDLLSAIQLNTFLRLHGLPQRAVTGDNIARATHEEAVAFTAWLTQQHRAAGIINNNTHYRLPTTTETRSTQIWRHDDNPSHTNTTRPVGIVLARGARP